jgi:hypothetical protein
MGHTESGQQTDADTDTDAGPDTGPDADRTESGQQAEAESDADFDIDNSETGVGVMIQEYDGSTVEILMVQYDGQQEAFKEYNWRNPEIEMINNMIESGPLRMYHDFLNGDYDDDLYDIDIRSYPFEDDDLVQIVTSCVGYSEDSNQYTKLWSYCFSKADNRIIELDEMLEEYEFTREEISEVFAELYRPDSAGERLVEAEVTGFLINNLPSRSVTNFLLEVTFEMEPASVFFKEFYMYMPEYDEVMELNSFLLFDPDVFDMVKMDPPLVYEWGNVVGDLAQPNVPDYELSADTVECSGILQSGSFYHDAIGEWMDFYYVDLGEEQYETLAAAYSNMDFLQAPGSAAELMQTAKDTQEHPYEIQVFSPDENLDISSFVGKEVRFSGNFFDAHTAYHVRYIVFNIESIEES